MRRAKIFLTVVVLCASALVSSLQADDNGTTVRGNFLFGYRMVDTSGMLEKYKEDINLDDGLRLFNFSLNITPNSELKTLFDRLDLNLYNFGGDPFETLGLSIQKYGKYQFRYDRRKSTYFYADQQEVGGGELYDRHTFDFDRVMDSGLLKFWLSQNIDIYLDFSRYTKKGESVITFDIDRVEFELDKPIKEEAKDIALGVNLHVHRFSFLFEERIQDYGNANSLFLPGYAADPSARYPSALNYFRLNQPYDLETATHTFRFTARPFDSLLVAGSARISSQDTNIDYLEEADGVSFLNRNYTYGFTGKGEFDRKIKLYDLDVTYLLFNKLALVGALRYHEFEQDGKLTVTGEGSEQTEYDFNTLGIEGGLQYQYSPKLTLTFGYRNETRSLDKGFETVTYENETTRNGLFGNIKWDPVKAFGLTFDYQRGDYEDPFTLIGPTDLSRLRIRAKWSISQLNVIGSYLWRNSNSAVDQDRWKSSRNQISLQAGYQAQKVNLSAGYSLIDVEHKADRTVAFPPAWSGGPGTFLWEIAYEGKSNLWNASVYADLSEQWKIGSYVQYYKNAGWWEIKRLMFKAYVEYAFWNGLMAHLGYRYVDFEEPGSGFNNYSANILELSFGYRWK